MSPDIPNYRLPGNYGKSDPAPAPLDPSKVKAGDTAEIRSGSTVVGGVVTRTEFQPRGVILWFEKVPNGYWVDDADDAEPFRLTAHQPAPEPEPEWKPGTVAEVETLTWSGRASWDGSSWVSLHDHNVSATPRGGCVGRDDDGIIGDVRPLVVMDPAAVVDELVDSLSHALGERLPPEAVAYISRTDGNNDRQKWVRGLLNHAQPNLVRSAFQVLGIEATR